jgi:hypothetical protein
MSSCGHLCARGPAARAAIPEIRSTEPLARFGAKGKSASASSATLRYRWRRSFSRHLKTTASSPIGTSGRKLRIAGAGVGRDLDRQLRHRVGDEGGAARHQLEEDDAERPDVRPRVDVLGRAHLLGRHVERRAHQRGRPRHRPWPGPARVGHLRDAEVEHLDRELAVRAPDAEEVRRLEVAVDDAERVRVGDGLAGLKDELDRLLDGQRAALLDPRREIPPRGTP